MKERESERGVKEERCVCVCVSVREEGGDIPLLDSQVGERGESVCGRESVGVEGWG